MAAVKPVDIRYRLFIIRPQIDFQIGKPYQHQVFLFRHSAADFPAAAQMGDEFVQLPQGVFVGDILFVLCHRDSVSYRQYSGLNLNQYGVASPCRTICTVCGFVALS